MNMAPTVAHCVSLPGLQGGRVSLPGLTAKRFRTPWGGPAAKPSRLLP